MDPFIEQQVSVLEQSDTPDPEAEAEDISRKISTIVSQLDTQERNTRDRMLRLWKYLELLWSGSGNYYWDHNTGQWRAITQEDIALISQENDIDPTLINKVVNIIRPYGESLAGVLTTGLPRVKFFPKDADKDLDIQASRAYSNVESKINDDNMMPLRLIEIIVKLWNGGFAAAYNYSHSDKKYGTYTEPVYGDRQFSQQSLICTECGNETTGPETEIETGPEDLNEAETDEAKDTDVSVDEMIHEQPETQDTMPPDPNMMMDQNMPETTMADCPTCGMPTPHMDTTSNYTKNVEVGQSEMNRSRQIINIYGPMNVKISSVATRQEHVFWLVLEEDLDVAYARWLYQDHRDKIAPTTSSMLDVDRLARSDWEIAEETLRETATIRKVWLKPAAYEKLENVDDIKSLTDKYPNGLMATFCADTFLEAEESDLDDHWTISRNPLYNRLICDPLGKALIGLHETTNDLFQLEVDTVRYAIPITIADPQNFDFNGFAQTRALPGSVIPGKRPPGGRMEDTFAQTRTATLPQGVEELDAKTERLIQFVSGVLPSVFGGPATGSKTLGEYQESKNQALQRLSIIWKIVTVMYAEMMSKATRQYVNNLKADENFVKPNGEGFMNVWLKREQFEGEIGEVRPEISEQFPMTWGQISGRIMELLGMNNQVITSWLLTPENIELMYKAIGVDELHLPGEDQRNKQLYEISEMLSSQPTVMPDPQTGQPMPASSVQIEEIDDDALHMQIVKAFLNSPVGIDIKMTNPMAYQNIMLHYMAHQQRLMMMQMQAQAQANQGQNSEPVQES